MPSKSKIFFWLCVAFVVGVVFASFVTFAPIVIWAFFVLGCVGVIYGVTSAKNESVRISEFIFLKPICYSLMVLVFVAGMFRFAQVSSVSHILPPDIVSKSISFEASIIDEPIRKPKSQQVVVASDNDAKILLIMRPYPEFQYGDILKISGTIEEPENFTDEFDYRAYLAKDDIFYLVRFPEVEKVGEGGANPIYQKLFLLKSKFSENLGRFLPEPHASFMAGLILGERKSMPQELLDQFAETGTTHIIALSGYNISIVADSFLKFLAWFSLPFSWSFVLATFGIVAFTILTGASASIVRAAIMGILVLVARKEGRLYHVRNALVFAGAVMIFQNPKILRFDVAFQLSFLATLGLIYVSPIIDGYMERMKYRAYDFFRVPRDERGFLRKQKKSFVREIFTATISAQVLVLPLLVYNFGRISIISPLSNLAVLIMIPATMLFGFLTAVSGFIFSPLAFVFSWVSWALLQYELSAIKFFANIPLASVSFSLSYGILLLPLYGIIGYWVFKKYRIIQKN
ncbi:MAG: ComEC/Rec2 family competence protein [bacterium]|nr:ComEC/Rec2 family competence protein [bacterium]